MSSNSSFEKMLSFSLLTASWLTLALASGVPPLSSCILNGNPCPTGSTCTPTQTCGGLCVTSFTPPPVVPCTVGNDKPCPTNAICTPTSVCQSPTPCGGQCIATTNPPTQPLPTQPCVIGANNCPTDAYCTQTEVCGGLCKCNPTRVCLIFAT